MSKDIIYSAQALGFTYFFRFYENGIVLRARVADQEVIDYKDEIPTIIVKNTHGVDNGYFRIIENKILFDIEYEEDVESYQGKILDDGSLHLSVYVIRSKKSGTFVIKPWGDPVHFDWKNTKYKSDPVGPLDLRLSTYKQLQHKLGEDNVFLIASEFLNESETPIIQFINDFLYAAGNELPNAELIIDKKWQIAVGQKAYTLNKDNPEYYVTNMQIVKDLNAILESQGITKRIFYFDDYTDNDMNPSYFYIDKDAGLQIIEFLNDPPFYSYIEFKNPICNRIINMVYVDSTTKIEAKYFKRLIAAF